jgi:hypothetical protein
MPGHFSGGVMLDRSRAFLLLAVLGSYSACRQDDTPPARDASGLSDGMQAPSDTPVNPPVDAGDAPASDGPAALPPSAHGTVAGRITLAGTNDPIVGAKLYAGNATAMTDDQGHFVLSLIPAGDRVMVRTIKAGFGESLEPVSVRRDGHTYLAASLLPATIVTQMDATLGGLVDDGAGSRARFTAGSLVRPNGELATGPVTVSVAALDPSDPVAMLAFPGDFSARRMDGTQALIETVVPMSVSVRQGNEELEIRSGMNAEITLPIPAKLAGDAPLTIPLWSLEESTGAWKEEGTATRHLDPDSPSGFVYKASVTHLSWWNADKPIEVTCIRGCAQVESLPAGGVVVHAAGTNYSGETLASTGPDGCFVLDLKRSSAAGVAQALVWAETADALSLAILIDNPEAIMRAGANPSLCRDIGTVTLRTRSLMNGGCPMGLTRCGEDCINLNADLQHCGACDSACDLACTGGACECPASQTQCGNLCINTRTDRQNCGACGNDCPGGQTCDGGACVDIVCPTGRSVCNDQCADINTDVYNCGACGRRCSVEGRQICAAGSCACPTGLGSCSAPVDSPGTAGATLLATRSVCVDFMTDRNNCGDCGTVCASGTTCRAGACLTIVCESGLTLCGNECVDLATNPFHCGRCSAGCYAEGGQRTCVGGTCMCPTGQTQCAYPGPTPVLAATPANDGGYRVCVDTQTNRFNCGTCGTYCPDGTTCTAGTCVAITCPTGQTLCGDTCADLLIDGQHCGACDQSCNGESQQVCRDGACGCPTGQTACTVGDGFTVCRETETDPYNCGGCGNACPGGQTCFGGGCVPITCDVGRTLCGESCTDLQTDTNNCGACGRYCFSEAREICAQGLCACPNGLTRCTYEQGYSVCRETQTDRYNCGACGITCPSGQTCSAGGCVALTCETGLSACGDECADLQENPSHCGGCGEACDGEAREVCRQGLCGCAAGELRCDYDGFSLCRSTQADRYNCGGCGNECPDNQICNTGVCTTATCQGDLRACAGSCVDLQTDPSNCGACEISCSTGVCNQGLCQPAGPQKTLRKRQARRR